MKVTHLNCGTMRPWGAPEGLVCHVLLVETGSGLALVDSGLGLRDRQAPDARFGPARHFVRPVFDEHEAAIRQIQALGHDPHDVRDIVLTHFDADHTGGLSDFPWARVHLTAKENDAALHPHGPIEKGRYLHTQRDHEPQVVTYEPAQGDSWRGFHGARQLTEIDDGIVLIALPGHSRGHAAVAVDAGDRWILHVGDAFYHHGQLDGTRSPFSLRAMERVIAYDWARVRANHARLRELWTANQPDVHIINAHDPRLFRDSIDGEVRGA
ncbi:MBL fold metallo-hydrolase [Rhodococcus sp. NPDC060086]|uniref:MBL fold metallo-hydrolase n=1 Tax=Rhodococcus sp. NPDC060086 TaxID=3347055 RepID=UPI003659102C